MRIVFKMGVKEQARRMMPGFWYAADYYAKGSKLVVTHIDRARFEDVGHRIVFCAPPLKYGQYLDILDVRKAIQDAKEEQVGNSAQNS